MFVLAGLLGAVLALPFWLMRWSLAWRMAVVYLLSGATSVLLSAPVGQSDRGYVYHLGVRLLIVLVSVLLLGFGARLIWQLWKRPRPGRAQRYVDRILSVWTGALIALAGFVALGWRTVDAPALEVHLATLASALVPLVLAFALRWQVARDGLWAMSAMLIVLTGLSGLVYPRLVLASAARIAGGDHCISLPHRRAAATELGQLTFLTLDKSEEVFSAPHATLVTDKGPVAHWSYHLTRFAPQVVHPPVTYCQPEGQAGLMGPERETVVTIRLESGEFAVPLAFAPFRGAADTLAISVTAPLMTPAPDPDFASAWLGLGQANSVGHLVHARSRFSPAPHGLERVQNSPEQEIYVLRDRGRVVTQIECWDVTCLQRFSPNGKDRIILDYHRDLLAQWRDMEGRASALFASFRS